MGKIYNALEKSKKEQEQRQKNQFKPLKKQPMDRVRTDNIPGKNPSPLDSEPIADATLGSIHSVLDDTVKMERAEKSTNPVKEKFEALESEKVGTKRRSPISEASQEISRERIIKVSPSTNKNKEPNRPMKSQHGDKPRFKDINDSDLSGLDFQPTPVSKLAAIQILLEGRDKMGITERDMESLNNEVKDTEEIGLSKQNRTSEPGETIKQGSTIDLTFCESNKKELLPKQKQEKDADQIDETMTVAKNKNVENLP